MKILLRMSAVALGLGMLGAAACSSCDNPKEADIDPAINGVQSYNCGPGTHLVGSQCVGNSQSTQGAAAAPLGTTGNN